MGGKNPFQMVKAELDELIARYKDGLGLVKL
jgi:hypothetical protein